MFNAAVNFPTLSTLCNPSATRDKSSRNMIPNPPTIHLVALALVRPVQRLLLRHTHTDGYAILLQSRVFLNNTFRNHAIAMHEIMGMHQMQTTLLQWSS